MRNVSFFGALLISFSAIAQKTIIVNGGQYGNPLENVNLLTYDHTNNLYSSLDTIHTQSVQEILIDGNWAYVAAQDSIIKYNLLSETRVASAQFNGPSTKSLALTNGILLVGNWYGRSSYNLYLYNTSNLSIIDSIAGFTKGVKSILVKNGYAFITQNEQNSSYQDTLGSIIRFDIPSRTILDTIQVSGYSGDFGELIENANGTGFYAFNSVGNTVTSVNYSTLAASNTTFPLPLNISGKSHWTKQGDTLFARFGNGIGAIDLSNLSILDSNIIDTIVTAFTYDTLNHKFFVTQTDFFSYNLGKVYTRSGAYESFFSVGYSPEVARMYYGGTLGLNPIQVQELNFKCYPNPAQERIFIEVDSNTQLQIIQLNGSLVADHLLLKGQNSLDISYLPKGSYVLLLKSGNSLNSKLVIKK